VNRKLYHNCLMVSFLMTLNDFKVKPLFDAEYLKKMVRDTDITLYSMVSFRMILSGLTKCSMI